QMKKELRFLNENVAFQYHANLRTIERLKTQLSSDAKVSISQATRVEMEAQLKSTEGKNRGLFSDLYKVLFQAGRFPTGLLPKFLAVLDGCDQKYEVSDLRRRPSNQTIKFILKESFPPLRYYQRTMSRLVMEKGRGIGVAPTGSGKSLTIARMIWELG